MPIISYVWRVGLPFAVVASSALVLVSAVRSREASAPVSRRAGATLVLVWLILAGDSALGDQRPLFERQWKGVAALLLALAGATHLWRRYRRRSRHRPGPDPVPQQQPSTAATAAPAPSHSSLAVPVAMPPLGRDVVEGTVTRWLKRAGDRVEAGEPLVEVSTDKVETEIPAGASGDLREIRVPAGRTAPVGTTIAVIEPHHPR